MRQPSRPAGAVRWWTPILVLLGGTAALVFAAAIGGADMGAAMQRLGDRLANTFHSSSSEWSDERGTLRLEFDVHDKLLQASFNGQALPLDQVVIENDYLTITSLTYDDGELMYWRIPLSREGDLREEVSNPRWWRTLMRVHPQPDGEPPGLRVARVDEDGGAGRAGVLTGDVIVAVDGHSHPTSAELEAALRRALAERAPGGRLTLGLERADEPLEITLDLQPLVSREEWDSVDVEDPVERYLVLRHHEHRRDYERGVEAHEDVEQATPPEPPPPGEG